MTQLCSIFLSVRFLFEIVDLFFELSVIDFIVKGSLMLYALDYDGIWRIASVS